MLALKLNVCSRSRRFWGIFWVDASTEANIERSFANIAQICGIQPETGYVKRWLSNRPDSWLLIFDNADDPSLEVSRYFPTGDRGSILITTRNPDCQVHATAGVCEIGKLDKTEAPILLLKASRLEDHKDDATRNAAEQVASLLGYLALAITHAGGVIREGKCTIGKYPQIFSRQRKELLDADVLQGKDGYDHKIYTTWEVSLSMIRESSSEAGRDAIELLNMFSFLHFESIPGKLFTRAWDHLREGDCPEWRPSYQPHVLRDATRSVLVSESNSGLMQDSEWDSEALEAALSILSSYSLIKRDKNGFISLHPLVHTWIRDRLDRTEEESLWRMAISTLACSARWWRNNPGDLRYRLCLVPHVDSCLHSKARDIFHHLGMEISTLETIYHIAAIYRDAGHLWKG